MTTSSKLAAEGAFDGLLGCLEDFLEEKQTTNWLNRTRLPTAGTVYKEQERSETNLNQP